MDPLGLLSSAVNVYRREGARYVLKGAARKGCGAIARRTGRYRGESIFESKWDLLVVLDACRPGALRTVAPEFDFLPDQFGTTYSVASCSSNWMKRTFTDEYDAEMAETAYVSANPFTEDYVSRERLFLLDELWKSAYDEDLGTIPAKPVTNAAIAAAREHQPDRLLVHYMQPHFPSVPEPLGFGIRMCAPDPDEQEWVWDNQKPDGISSEDLWNAYIENLRYVLEEVEVLLENVDAERTIISADHGNAFGEWGMWGHPIDEPFPVLREVPWVETSARDTGSRTPDYDPTVDEEAGVEEKLRALGYK